MIREPVLGPRYTRRTFLKASAAALGIGSTAACKLITTYDVEWKRFSLPLFKKSSFARPLCIAHLSDLHASEAVPFDYLERVFTRVQAARPDLICLTGDFISDLLPEPRRYRHLLRTLTETAPCYAVTGNHDGGKWAVRRGGYADTSNVRTLLEDARITLLTNESRLVELHGIPIRVTGLGDPWAGECDPETAFAGIPGDHLPHIVLSHNPDTKEALQAYPWDLLLAGHTHGGQLRIPGMGAPLAPVNDIRFTEGLHIWNDRHLCISKGIGNHHGLRINCPPDVCLIEVTA